MTPPVRLGAVSYLNARPLVFGLDRAPEVSLRFDVPSRCADLLHQGAIDVGLIPSIEYLRAPAGRRYAIVPDLAIASDGAVASVAIYSTRPIADIRSIALDTSSRSSVALVRVLCAKVFGIDPVMNGLSPDISLMLERSDAALIIGDIALLQDGGDVTLPGNRRVAVEKIDLGEVWTKATGLPFVYAFWAGMPGVLTESGVARLHQARDEGVAQLEVVGRQYFPDAPGYQSLAVRYLRDNIRYTLGSAERAGLELFYRYAAETGVVDANQPLRFL